MEQKWWASPDRWWRTVTARQRWRIRLLALVTIGCTGTISFESLRNLAQFAGFGWLSWLFPICIDAVAALGMDVWLSKSPAYKLGATLAISAVGLSLCGNVADWWIKREGMPYQWLTALLGAVPPAALAFELWVMHRHAHAPNQVPNQEAGAPGQGAADDPLPSTPTPGAPEPAAEPGVAPEPEPGPRTEPEPEPEPAVVHQPTNGAPLPLVHRDRFADALVQPKPPAPRVAADEQAMVHRLRVADPRGEWTRRRVEEYLTAEFDEKVGSSRAARLMAAARNGVAR